MLGEIKLKQLAKLALKHSKAGQTEVVISTTSHALSRFANSQLHQNTQYLNASVGIRVIVDKKIGVSSTNRLDRESIINAVERATSIAKMQREDPHFVSLPAPARIEKVARGYEDSTASHTPDEKAKVIGAIFKKAKDNSLISSGAFETDVTEVAVANSLGVWAYHPMSMAKLSVTVTADNSTGYASEINADVGSLSHEDIIDRAVAKAVKGRDPIDIEPGDYEVLLEPTAVNDLLDYFAYLGPNARIFHEDVSFMAGKIGQQVLSENITIYDDAMHPDVAPLPFDFEGAPRQKVTLFDKGVARSIVYDSYHAQKHNQPNTGHALPAPDTQGPMPGHLVFEPGLKSTAEMMQSIKRGLLITRFWYVNALHYKSLLLTGMTRDGTFLIENGEIVKPVKNLRFTQSVIEAFKDVEQVGKELKKMPGIIGTNLVPAMHIRKFHFSSKAEH